MYHGTVSPDPSPGVLLANLGTPDAPTTGAVRRYLRQFLLDRRVVDAPRIPWWLLLHVFILPRRSPRVASLYRSIWTDEGSPLLAITHRQATLLQEKLEQRIHGPVTVVSAMRYGKPSMAQGLRRLRDAHCSPIVVLPLFPQYSGSTIGSAFDAVAEELSTWRHVPEFRFVSGYHTDDGYLGALEASIRQHWEEHGRFERLLISFHGIPQRYADAGDPYAIQCAETARLLAERLELEDGEWALAYQSRFGREPWIGPAVDRTLTAWGREGLRSVAVVSPGFAADCLETLHEIAREARALFQRAGGGSFHYIPALNDRTDHVEALAGLVQAAL